MLYVFVLRGNDLPRKPCPASPFIPIPFFLTTLNLHTHGILNLPHADLSVFVFLALSFLFSSLINMLASKQIQSTLFWMGIVPKTFYFTKDEWFRPLAPCGRNAAMKNVMRKKCVKRLAVQQM